MLPGMFVRLRMWDGPPTAYHQLRLLTRHVESLGVAQISGKEKNP
jgi:hypothetical protein